MYAGRIVGIGKNLNNKICALYRVSSRSFPDREAKCFGENVAIVPKSGYEEDLHKNPFISYNCLSIVNQYAIASNGSQTDAITWKIRKGNSIRDTLIAVLHTFDFEQDALNTPRIAAIVDTTAKLGYLGIVTMNSFHVQEFKPAKGTIYYVSTYEYTNPNEKFMDSQFNAESAQSACTYILSKGVFSEMGSPITSVCALENESGSFEIAIGTA